MVDNEQVNKATENARTIYLATEEALELDWDQKDTIQFPSLLTFVLLRLKVDARNASDVDPYMRSYVRNQPKFYVTRGAKGGVMLRSVWEARQAKKAAVEAAKKDIKAQIDAKTTDVVAANDEPVVVGDEVNE